MSLEERGFLQDVQDQLDEAGKTLDEFKTKLSDVESSLRELSALAGLNSLAIGSHADVHTGESQILSFRANITLWSWIMELPVVKS